MRTLIALTITAFSFSAFSAASYTSCSNGTIEEVGDALFTAYFFDDSISLNPYEGSLSFGVDDISWKGNTTVVMDVQTVYSVEGTEEDVVVDAIITLSADNKAAKVAYSMNKGSFQTYDLMCEEVPYIQPEQ